MATRNKKAASGFLAARRALSVQSGLARAAGRVSIAATTRTDSNRKGEIGHGGMVANRRLSGKPMPANMK